MLQSVTLVRLLDRYPVHAVRRLQHRRRIRRLGVGLAMLRETAESPTARDGRRRRRILRELVSAWGNRGFAAEVEYLARTARLAARTDRPVLECGSGLTTLLLASLAGRRGIPVRTLEHHPKWAAHLAEMLDALDLADSVRLVHTPLRNYGGYHWYEIEPEDGLPPFGLVICDGPPGITPGGRYGLLPILGPRLAEDCVILLDDVDRKGERDVLDRWISDARARIGRVAHRADFAEIRLATPAGA